LLNLNDWILAGFLVFFATDLTTDFTAGLVTFFTTFLVTFFAVAMNFYSFKGLIALNSDSIADLFYKHKHHDGLYLHIMRITKNYLHKIWPLIIIVVVMLIITTCIWLFISKPNKSTEIAKSKIIANTTELNNVIHMAAMGDMLAHDTIIANAKTDSDYDFSKYFTNIRPSYKNADVIFCNQEGLSSGNQYIISGYPSFNAPTRFSSDLQSGAGCNLINLANNHMGDKGVAATNVTIDNWTSLKPLAISGANKSVDDQNKVSFAVVKGIKIGFVSFADFNNNKATPDYSINNYHDEALVKRLVTQARANALGRRRFKYC